MTLSELYVAIESGETTERHALIVRAMVVAARAGIFRELVDDKGWIFVDPPTPPAEAV